MTIDPSAAQVAATSATPERHGRLLARLLSPVAAVVPWLLTVAGLALAQRSYLEMVRAYRESWGTVLGAAAVLVLAALLWALVVTWSSTGPLLAGAATLLLGVVVVQRDVSAWVWQRSIDGFGPTGAPAVNLALSAPSLLLVGSLLLAVGAGAAGARRWPRRR